MLDTTPQGLWTAKNDAVTLRNLYLSLVKERMVKLCGNKYRSDWGGTKQLEQYLASYMGFMLPQMVADNPVVQVKPRTDPRDTAGAEGTQALVNMWIDCKKYKRRVLKPCAIQMLIGWAVTYRGIDLTDPDGQGLPVFCKTLDIGDYFCDPNAFGYANRRFEGHCFDKSKEQLLADPKYAGKESVIADLVPNTQARKRDSMPGGSTGISMTKGDLVTLWQFYLMESGEIVTLTESGGGAAELCREQYVGPREGPYGMWGVFEIAGQIYPLSPVATWEEQSDDLNLQAASVSKSAKTHKKFVIGRKSNAADAKTVQSVKHGEMILLDDPGSVTDAESGGVSETQLKALEMYKERLDRSSALSDAQRGMATGRATLGENQLAQNNTDARTSYVAGCLKECAEDDLAAVGWFFHNSSDIIARTSIEDANTGVSRPVEIYGGAFEAAEVEALIAQGVVDPAAIYSVGKEWSDYHLKIELESMQRVADPIRQKRAQDEMAMVVGIVPIIAAAGGPAAALTAINWRRLLRRYGNAFNEPQYDRIVFTEAFSAMVAAMGGNPSAMPGGVPEPGMGPMGAGAPGMAPVAPPMGQPPAPGMAPPMGQPSMPMGGMPSPVTRQGINQNTMGGVAAA
jgi:hypothetical protein